jgi:hypothetical protein
MSRRTLDVAPGFGLPLEAITETFGLLAVRGAGKSNAGRVFAEEMFPAHLPFVAVDVVGAWWGLRSARNGRGPGLPVPIFGGRHGDVPLERTGGALIADLIVDTRLSCVLDLSGFEEEDDKKQFLLDFARRLYRRNRDPLHLFLDEADDYIPQEMDKGDKPLVKAWATIVRRGRQRGIGCTLLTQRSAALNKDVLEQVGTLIALRTAGPNDRDAIGRYLKYHAQSPEILSSLAGLRDGEAWVVSPHFLGRTVKVRFRLSQTFDSGATPKIGRRRRRPATLADVNLGEIQQRMAATIERVQAGDPTALQAEMARLRAEVARLRAELAAKPKVVLPVPAATPVAPKPDREAERRAKRKLQQQEHRVAQARKRAVLHLNLLAQALERGTERFEALAKDSQQWVTRLRTETATLTEMAAKLTAPVASDRVSSPSVREIPLSAALPPRPIRPVVLVGPPPPRKFAPAPSANGMPKTHRRVLGAVRWWEAVGVTTPSRGRVAFAAGYAPKGGSFGNYVGTLRTEGFVTYPAEGQVALTETGRAAVPPPEARLTTAAIHQKVEAILPAARWRVLAPILAAYPQVLTRAQVGEACGMEPKGGSFGNYLGALRTAGCIEYPAKGMVCASADLFVGGP